MDTVFVIADAILKIAKEQNKKVTPLQLLKLVYISEGWSLALRNKTLFSNRIEAWQYGPVVPDLYHRTKNFGGNPIPYKEMDYEESSLSGEDFEFQKEVYNAYRDYSGIELSSITHQTDSPWYQVYKHGEYKLEIPHLELKKARGVK